jgi:hypothetical protein
MSEKKKVYTWKKRKTPELYSEEKLIKLENYTGKLKEARTWHDI